MWKWEKLYEHCKLDPAKPASYLACSHWFHSQLVVTNENSAERKNRASQGKLAGARGALRVPLSPIPLIFSSLDRRSPYGPTNWGPGTGYISPRGSSNTAIRFIQQTRRSAEELWVLDISVF